MVMALDSLAKPKRTCNDVNCPFHGSLSIRGRILEGVVVKDKMDKTVVVRRDYLKLIRKYKRYEKRHAHLPAHKPPCIDASKNDFVKIAECRPISKTVSFVVIERIKSARKVGSKS
jgi:small subunit ribosomal protein S17